MQSPTKSHHDQEHAREVQPPVQPWRWVLPHGYRGTTYTILGEGKLVKSQVINQASTYNHICTYFTHVMSNENKLPLKSSRGGVITLTYTWLATFSLNTRARGPQASTYQATATQLLQWAPPPLVTPHVRQHVMKGLPLRVRPPAVAREQWTQHRAAGRGGGATGATGASAGIGGVGGLKC